MVSYFITLIYIVLKFSEVEHFSCIYYLFSVSLDQMLCIYIYTWLNCSVNFFIHWFLSSVWLLSILYLPITMLQVFLLVCHIDILMWGTWRCTAYNPFKEDWCQLSLASVAESCLAQEYALPVTHIHGPIVVGCKGPAISAHHGPALASHWHSRALHRVALLICIVVRPLP